MSSTSTLTVASERIELDGVSKNEQNELKSPPATLQSIRQPSIEDVFPTGVNQASSPGRSIEQLELDDTQPPEGQAVEAKETWKNPKINTYRLAYIFLTMFNLGLHDASYGPLIPSLETYYSLNYTTVSLVFLATFPGYLLAAFTSDRIHLKFGPRGIAAIASTMRIATYIAMVCHPPWAIIVVLLVLCGMGNGLLDAGWNAWVGGLDRPNELLGFIHSLYGLGAAVAPLIASAMVDRSGLAWYEYYYIPLALACVELGTGIAAFWKEDGPEFRRKNASSRGEGGRTRAALKLRVTWTLSIFLLFYVGAEVALSGWVVTFMQRVRGAPAFDSSLTATGFWLGVTVGRLVLGFITPRLGERWSIVGYLAIGMGLELVFWLVPQFVVSAVAVALLGFFLGPMFPAAVVVLSKTLPKHLHVGAISFTAAVGMGGAAVIPFAVGAIASAAGVKALQPIILGILAIMTAMWLTLPKVPKDKRSE